MALRFGRAQTLGLRVAKGRSASRKIVLVRRLIDRTEFHSSPRKESLESREKLTRLYRPQSLVLTLKNQSNTHSDDDMKLWGAGKYGSEPRQGNAQGNAAHFGLDQWWSICCMSNTPYCERASEDSEMEGDCPGLWLLLTSEPASAGILSQLGLSLLTVYTIFVMAVGSQIRLIFTGENFPRNPPNFPFEVTAMHGVLTGITPPKSPEFLISIHRRRDGLSTFLLPLESLDSVSSFLIRDRRPQEISRRQCTQSSPAQSGCGIFARIYTQRGSTATFSLRRNYTTFSSWFTAPLMLCSKCPKPQSKTCVTL